MGGLDIRRMANLGGYFAFVLFLGYKCNVFADGLLYNVDISEGFGRRFDGIGGLSGGGVSIYLARNLLAILKGVNGKNEMLG